MALRSKVKSKFECNLRAPPHHRPLFVRSFVRSLARSLARWRARRENFSSTRKFRRRENFGKKVWVVAIVFVKKSSKSELSSRFSGRLKILQGLEGHDETCEVPIWRSCDFLSVTMIFVSKNHPRCPKNQLSMIFGGGVKKSFSIFFLIFGAKLTCTFWSADMMV